MNFHFIGKWRIPVERRGKRKGERKRERKSKLSGKYRINDVFSPQDGLWGFGAVEVGEECWRKGG